MSKRITLIMLGLLLFAVFAYAQNNVTGKVIDASTGSGIPGVSVSVKGQKANAVATGNDGSFSIRVPSNAVLVFSSIGYSTKEINVGSQSVINVKLSEDAKTLEGVVVTALGITREKKALAYSAQSVTSEEINFGNKQNMLNALQGKIAGATISSTGGAPGQGTSIRIRGVNSIDPNVSGDPLYVIDGVQIDNTTSSLGASTNTTGGLNFRGIGNRVSDVNPEDIETINILKGGAATALYGLRGANGVVVITTKKGKSGAVTANFSSSYGVDMIGKTPKTQKVYTSGVLGNYNNGSLGIGPAWGPTIAEAKLIDPSHPDFLYDNYKQAYDNGSQLRNSVSLAGGTENVRFFSSVSSYFQEGMMPFTDYRNLSARLNTDVTISPKIKAGVNMSFTNSGGYRYGADRFGESLAYWSPRWNVKDYLKPDGTQNFIGTNNPIFGAATNRFKDDVNRFIGGASLSYQPTTWLNFSYRFGFDTYGDNRLKTAPGPMGITGEATYDNGLGSVGEFTANSRIINSTFVATLNSKLTADINGTLRLGHELYDKRYREVGTTGSELAIYNFFNFANARVLSASQLLSERRLMGFFGEATLDYKNYLFLTVTGRNDITSTLSPDQRSFFYPSASLAYAFSDHLKLPSYIGQSKLRFSYARVGKDAREYATSVGFTGYSSLPTGYNGLTISSNLGNPALRPEFTDTYEAGLEMSFFKNRLGFDLTYYYSLSKDQIVQAQISSATGYVTTSINSGDMRNRGFEVVLRGSPIKSKNFSWDATLNFSANRNKILTMPDNLSEIVYGTARGYGNAAITQKIILGESYGNIYGTYWQRYYGSDAEDPIRTDKSRPQLIGADGFPVISGTKTKLLGNSQPDWIGGLTNTFTYKNITLNTLIDARVGFEKYDYLENFYAAFGLPEYTLDRRSFKVFDGVLANGTTNTKQVWLGQGTGPDGVAYGEGYYRRFYRLISEPFVQDASWVRLRSVTLTYNLPKTWLPKKAIRNASIGITGNNLVLITKYYGLDPESSSFDASSNVDGVAGFTYPTARTVMFNLNVGF